MRHRYTPEEDKLILDLRRSGMMFKEIARRLGPSFTADMVRGRYMRLNEALRGSLSDANEGASMNADGGSKETLRSEIWASYEKLKEENAALRRQLEQLRKQQGLDVKLHRYSGRWVRFGVISDTHLGSLYEALNTLHLAYQIFKREGIQTVYHAGDLLDGEKMYRGQEYEIHTHGADAQVEHCAQVFPRINGITTYFICGNHDLSFWRRSGVDIGERISAQREDMIYMGPEMADIRIENEHGKAIIQLVHPGRGVAYALSYQAQKYIESLPGGRKPNMVVMGHYHKIEYLFYRNIHLLQAGCLQYQTPYMRRRNIAAMTGFWIVELKLDEKGIAVCKQQFYPAFEEPDWRD